MNSLSQRKKSRHYLFARDYTLLDIPLLVFPLNDREMFLDRESHYRNLAICLPERIFIVLQIYLAMPDIVLSGC